MRAWEGRVWIVRMVHARSSGPWDSSTMILPQIDNLSHLNLPTRFAAILPPRPRQPRHNPRRNISPRPVLACHHTDFPRFAPQRHAFSTTSNFQNSVSEALGRPLGRSLATRPEAYAELLGELRVVVQVCPEGEDDLWDAGARGGGG
jgi:hypothetical protein